ncbi:MAG: hypothetical protein QOG77_2956 [Solirubrobacteraceae bacterium]|nr:hypothetical protein [Solirubrobacteraceae bacterium]
MINEPYFGSTHTSCVEACPVDEITSADQIPPGWRDPIERTPADDSEPPA